MSFPGGDFAAQSLGVIDPAIQALASQDADFDLDHVEPTCVLWGVVELEPSQDPPGFGRRECLIQAEWVDKLSWTTRMISASG